MMGKLKFYIFSDESGTWHSDDVYVRAWVIISEDEHIKLINKIGEINEKLGSKEVKWKTVAGNSSCFKEFSDINFRFFITVSSPLDIDWNNKYKILRDFNEKINSFDFGKLDDDLVNSIKKKIYDDIKNVLFLHYYERFHIENATKGIEKIIKPTDYDLIYRIDPPQMSIDGWKDVLLKISNKKPEFPKSERDPGIQFADIVAGCCRSLFMNDSNFQKAKDFFVVIKGKMIRKDKDIPNPNMIFYKEMNEDLKERIGNIWKL
jgi:hypothetical protein